MNLAPFVHALKKQNQPLQRTDTRHSAHSLTHMFPAQLQKGLNSLPLTHTLALRRRLNPDRHLTIKVYPEVLVFEKNETITASQALVD